MSLKPRKGRSWKRLRRIQIAAELEARFIPDAEIANHLGITVPALTVIKATPEYQALRVSLASGVLSVYQNQMLESDQARKDMLDALLPTALTAVQKILENRDHPHHAKVALDILDRSRATSKISRTEHSVAPPESIEDKNKQANALLDLLGSPSPSVADLAPTPQLANNPLTLEDDEDEGEEEAEEVIQ